MPLTTNLNIKGVLINNSDLQEGFLPKSSIVVYEKIGVISHDLVIKKMGTLERVVFLKILKEFVQFVQQ